MSTPNAPELRRVLAHIETLPIAEGPDSWDQEDYRCKTGMCFAGHTAVLNGGIWAEPERFTSWLVAVPTDDPRYVYQRDGRSVIKAAARAQQILGLDGVSASWLFEAGNTLDDLRRIVAELCEQAEQVTP